MDNLTPEQRKKNMQNIRSINTKPERMLISELKKLNLNFQTHYKKLIGKPDIAFCRKKVAVFVDSDFWHGHPKRFKMPKTNKKYWTNKIINNIARDKTVTRELKKMNWTVIRFWEYDIKHKLCNCVKKLLKIIHGNDILYI